MPTMEFISYIRLNRRCGRVKAIRIHHKQGRNLWQKIRKKAGAGRTIVILLVVLLLLLTAGAYGYGVYYFSSHFLPGSMVNGFNCSYMASEDTEDLLNQRVSAYVLAVETMKNGQEAISAQDVGLSYVSTGIVKQLIKDRDRFTWFLAFNQDKNYDISESLSYNVELMGQAVDNLKCMQPENVVQPVDAQIQDTGDTFEIIPEVMGNALDRTKTEEVISAAMLRGKNFCKSGERELLPEAFGIQHR